MAGQRQVLLGWTHHRRTELQGVSEHDFSGFGAVDYVYVGGGAEIIARIFVGVAISIGGLADVRARVLDTDRDDGSWDTSEVAETAAERPERPAERTDEGRAARTDEETGDGEMERHDEFFPAAEGASLLDKQRLRGEV